MKIDDLINELEKVREEHGGEKELHHLSLTPTLGGDSDISIIFAEDL